MKTFNKYLNRITGTTDTKCNVIVLLAISLIAFCLTLLVCYTLTNPDAVKYASF